MRGGARDAHGHPAFAGWCTRWPPTHAGRYSACACGLLKCAPWEWWPSPSRDLSIDGAKIAPSARLAFCVLAWAKLFDRFPSPRFAFSTIIVPRPPPTTTTNAPKPRMASASAVLPKGQLARLRQQASTTRSVHSLTPSSSSSLESRDLQQLSNARIAGWVDTVEAKRDKKLRAKAERKAAEEAERERLDAGAAREAGPHQGIAVGAVGRLQDLSLGGAVHRHLACAFVEIVYAHRGGEFSLVVHNTLTRLLPSFHCAST